MRIHLIALAAFGAFCAMPAAAQDLSTYRLPQAQFEPRQMPPQSEPRLQSVDWFERQERTYSERARIDLSIPLPGGTRIDVLVVSTPSTSLHEDWLVGEPLEPQEVVVGGMNYVLPFRLPS